MGGMLYRHTRVQPVLPSIQQNIFCFGLPGSWMSNTPEAQPREAGFWQLLCTDEHLAKTLLQVGPPQPLAHAQPHFFVEGFNLHMPLPGAQGFALHLPLFGSTPPLPPPKSNVAPLCCDGIKHEARTGVYSQAPTPPSTPRPSTDFN